MPKLFALLLAVIFAIAVSIPSLPAYSEGPVSCSGPNCGVGG